jgi:hypothetical protein
MGDLRLELHVCHITINFNYFLLMSMGAAISARRQTMIINFTDNYQITTRLQEKCTGYIQGFGFCTPRLRRFEEKESMY